MHVRSLGQNELMGPLGGCQPALPQDFAHPQPAMAGRQPIAVPAASPKESARKVAHRLYAAGLRTTPAAR